MPARLILQSPVRPAEILTHLEALAAPTTSELRIAVAYATKNGCDELLPRLVDRIGAERWDAIPKAAIVSTDFHITEPTALESLGSHGFAVRLANTPASSFHPKLYAFGRNTAVYALVGSANLTRAALTVNTEAATVGRLSRAFASTWAQLADASVSLTDDILDRYRRQRRKRPPRIFPDPLPRAAQPSPKVRSAFADAVFAEVLDLPSFDALWVEAGSMSSSGSHAQLELPRGASRFFGFDFDHYDGAHHLIGIPLLFSGGRTWDDRQLTWHGNNRMERMNLPTIELGGFAYGNTAILFKRQAKRFQLMVAPWGSATAEAWRSASRKTGHLYKLGRRTKRICGVF